MSGTARSLDAGPGPDDAAGRVRIVQLHARDGRAASRIRRVGADPPNILDTGAAEGDVADCLRRAIGLPTPPPPCGPVAWWAVDWLDAMLEAVCRDPARPWTWARVSRLHPLLGSAPARQPRGPRSSSWPGRAPGCDWSSVRSHVGAEGGSRCPIGPELAAWMDDGMFARWLLGSRPDPVDVVVDLVDLLPPSVTRGVVEALQAWRCW